MAFSMRNWCSSVMCIGSVFERMSRISSSSRNKNSINVLPAYFPL